MSTYRIFTIGEDQHFTGMPVLVDCADDNAAVDKAMQLVDGHDLEVWDHKRMIARLPRSPPKV